MAFQSYSVFLLLSFTGITGVFVFYINQKSEVKRTWPEKIH